MCETGGRAVMIPSLSHCCESKNTTLSAAVAVVVAQAGRLCELPTYPHAEVAFTVLWQVVVTEPCLSGESLSD